MITNTILSLLPVITILIFIFIKDKQEKEPLKLLIKAFLSGGFILVPVLLYGQFLNLIFEGIDYGNVFSIVFSFLFAAIPEESFKYLVVMLLIWKNPHFNEKFDGIVYAVFVSLGFATLENLLYVFGAEDPSSMAIGRAFTAVPAHATFGIAMGYFISLAKYNLMRKQFYLVLALIIPIILHGMYNTILYSQSYPLIGDNDWEYLFWNMVFVPFCIFLWVQGFKKIKKLSAK